MKLNFKKLLLTSFAAMLFLIPSLVWANGFIVPTPPRGVLASDVPPLAIKYNHVEVEIDNQVAVTKIDQVFINEYNHDLEGTYIFPLPEEASISDFAMFIGGERISGEILEKDEARKIYEDIVRRMKDPAILEYLGRNLFRARIYPIPARGEKRIQLSYSQVLKSDGDIVRYLYPLNTEKLSSKPLQEVAINLKVKSGSDIKAVYSPSHEIDVNRIRERELVVGFEENNMIPDKDFVLYYALSEEDFGVNLLTHRVNGSDGYFMLMIAPKLGSSANGSLAKDIVLVLDRSGSMKGDKIVQAKGALKGVVNGLDSRDRFNIITFSSGVDAFASSLVQASAANRRKALSFVDDLEANGGTNINEAFLRALRMEWGGERPSTIVFLTDGLSTVGEKVDDKIVKNIKKANGVKGIRIFTFGVGYDVNTHLLDKISGGNGGVSDYVVPEEDIEIKVSLFYEKIRHPVLTAVGLDYGHIRDKDVYPGRIGDIFKGTQFVLVGRYKNGGESTLVLSGLAGEENRSYNYEVFFPDEERSNDFIPRLWATRRIGFLLDEIRLNGEDKELVDEVISLSKKYGVMTPYTSFLVTEDEKMASSRPETSPRKDAQPTLRLSSTSDEAAGAGAAPAAPMEMRSQVGEDAVSASKKIKSMKEEERVVITLVDRIKHVGSKTFYFKEEFWVDGDYKDEDEVVEIKYASEQYFELMRKEPELGKYLSLGEKVVVCYQNKCYKTI